MSKPPQIFTPEHYRTAEAYEADFSDEWPEAEILAEVDLTLTALQNWDSGLSISRGDLDSYHFLHYGGRRGAGRFAVDMLLSGAYKDHIRSDELQGRFAGLDKRLSYVLGPDRLSVPLPLGRFQLAWIPEKLWLPEEFMDYFEGTVPSEPVRARNPGPFIYPKEGVSLSYAGTARTDTPLGQLVFNELAEANPELIDRCYPNIGRADLGYPDDMPALHLDDIALKGKDSDGRFIAISSESVTLAVGKAGFLDA